MTRRRQESPSFLSIMNIVAFVLLMITLGRLMMVIRGSSDRRTQEKEVGSNRFPMWVPAPADPVEDKGQAWLRRRQAADAVPPNKRARLGAPGEENRGMGLNTRGKEVFQIGVEANVVPNNGGYKLEEFEDCLSTSGCWGTGMKVLIFTMDSLADRVELAAKGGPAGEIKIRESLSKALEEAGVEVDVAISDRDFERRADDMDMYDAYVLDPWTWAGKGWRLKSQLSGRQHKMFILDFFGADSPHQNLGVPLKQYLTAFPVPPEMSRTFLGYRIDPSDVLTGRSRKKRQGVIWGKTVASFKGARVEKLILRLANFVELHSTVDPMDAQITYWHRLTEASNALIALPTPCGSHQNIVYHGILSKKEWRHLLEESKFMIGLGDPLSGPSAVDALLAGCMYINPVYPTPMKKIYHSQHPFLEENVGEPHVCSFLQEDVGGALACAERALEQDLEAILPQELTKKAHQERVRNIFEPLMRDENA